MSARPQGRTKPAAVLDTLTTQTQRQAATIANPSILATPTVEPVAPKPGRNPDGSERAVPGPDP